MTTLAELVVAQAAAQPDATAFTGGGVRHTYGSLNLAASQVANGLDAAGVGPGDRVAYWAKNSVEFFEVLFGAAKLNAPPVALNWRLRPRDVAYILTDCAAKVVVVADSFTEMMAEIRDDLRSDLRVLVLGADYGRWRDAQRADDISRPSAATDVALQLYTSGTTGIPKGVMLTHRNWTVAVETNQGVYDLDATSVQLLALPLFHIGGLLLALLSVVAGAESVVLPEADPTAMLALTEEHAATHVPMVPALLAPYLTLAEAQGTDLHSVSSVFYGGAPMPESLLRKAMSAMDAKFSTGWGMTETTATVTFLTSADHCLPDDPATAEPVIRRLRSVGRAAPQARLKIVDSETMAERPTGVHGEVLVRGEQVMKGYWNLAQQTAAAVLPDGWLRTGDGGYLDEEGYLFLTDRIKDMIISGGENIYPAEIENALAALAGVREVAVIGVPHQRWGETPLAVIVGDGELSAQEALDHCRANLAHYKCPTAVRWVDSLPRTPSGKVMKNLLREQFRTKPL